MTVNEIRQQFLDFFKEKGHTIVPSAPMVVKDDPTLMFTNAGMNPFKEWFLGNSPILYSRVADSQKCLRVSGKHNDLEEVGHDTYHHTMFEMLGNWSFGDYFKKEAIAWAWELLTEVYKLNPDRLYATYFGGSPEIDEDRESYNLWTEFLPKNHIVPGNQKNNFWEMGETGPCGPCSEIHIDLRSQEERDKIPGDTLINTGHFLVIEIWNLVFIQYNRKANGELETLSLKHVDTGMGLERLCMAIEGKCSNYDTGVFRPLLRAIGEICGMEYGSDPQADIAMRVIADHLRAISFSIADGQLPSNIKAGYVIRRILRRAVRYGYTFLTLTEPFLCRLVPALVGQMGDAFPELRRQQALIEKVIRQEEEAFLRVLAKGIHLFEYFIKDPGISCFSGKDAFLLYDTYGFPIDLTVLMAKEKGIEVNVPEFERELEAQKERARKASETKEGDWVELLPFTQPEFVGYQQTQATVKILRYRKNKSKNKDYYQLVFDRTPFYAESGGQVGDTGTISNIYGELITVYNTQKENNLIVHLCETLPRHVESEFIATIDTARRRAISNNHTATHLMHYALRQVLGKHVEQKGSLVTEHSLRFDFSHYAKMEQAEIFKVERIVNDLIRSNIPLRTYTDLPIEEAKKMGAMALFSEKYGSRVRVACFGDSKELCGGTHTSSTGNIGIFKIHSESAIAAGVRRIEASTGPTVENRIENLQTLIATIQDLFNNHRDVVQAIHKHLEQSENMRKELESVVKMQIENLKVNLIKEQRTINGVHFAILKGKFTPDMVKKLAFSFKDAVATAFIAATDNNDKPGLTLSLTRDLTEKGLDAGSIIREAAKHIRGGGGGQAFYATAGGKYMAGTDRAIDTIIALTTK